MAGQLYYYTGIGSKPGKNVYTRNHLLALLRENNHLFNPPHTPEELENDEIVILESGAEAFDPNNWETKG